MLRVQMESGPPALRKGCANQGLKNTTTNKQTTPT